jgi:hypothetical protein
VRGFKTRFRFSLSVTVRVGCANSVSRGEAVFADELAETVSALDAGLKGVKTPVPARNLSFDTLHVWGAKINVLPANR